MKEATGELNMTVITVVAIAAVAALFTAFVWPMIQRTIANNTCKTYGHDFVAYPGEDLGAQYETIDWVCCPEGQQNSDRCVAADLVDNAGGN